jgi:hypothetical protein
MTKTFAKIAGHGDIKFDEPGMMGLAQGETDPLFEFLNLGHWDLFEIWYLVLGIFMPFVERAIFIKLVIYLLK